MNRIACRLGLTCLLLCSFPALGQEWTRFRGPNGSGLSEATTIPATWTNQDYNWRVKLPGTGYSSPVVWGDRIFVTCAEPDDATRIIRCLDTSDGGMIWKRSFASSPHSMHDFNSYASASPAVDQDHVYLVFTTPEQYTVRALDLEKGREIWQRDLGPFVAQHGSGASPILYNGMLICTADKDEDSFVIALDRLTGETRWKVDRRSEKAAYSTPCIYQPEGGKPQLILTSLAHGFTALDPASGQTIWELPIMKYRCVGSPAIAAGLIFATGGEGGIGRQMFAVRPGVPEKGIEAEVAYEVKGSLPYVCTPVAYGDLLFSWFDKGVVTCLDAPTGKVHWQERVGGDFFGSPVRVADRIYCISRKGEMVVLAAADQFKLLGRIDLEGESHSTPVVADGVMYLRTVSHLMAIGGEK